MQFCIGYPRTTHQRETSREIDSFFLFNLDINHYSYSSSIVLFIIFIPKKQDMKLRNRKSIDKIIDKSVNPCDSLLT